MANHPTFMWQFVVSWLCVQQATSESTFTLQSKVYHFPIWRRIRPLFEGPRRTGTSRTLSQFPTVVPAPLPFPSPLPLSLPAPVELRFMKICVAGAASSGWRIAIAAQREKPFGGVATPLPATPSQLAVLVHLFWFVWNNNRCLPFILFIVQIINAWQ